MEAVEIMGLAFQIKDELPRHLWHPGFGKRQGGDILEASALGYCLRL